MLFFIKALKTKPLCSLVLLLLGGIEFSLAAKPADEARLKMYYGLAEGHYLTGNLSAAQNSLEEILRLDPYNPLALELQAKILLNNTKVSTAGLDTKATLEAIEASVKKGTGSNTEQTNDLRLAQARLLARSGKAEAAINVLQALTAQHPNHLEANLTLAALYASAGRWQSVDQLVPPLAAQPQLRDVALYLEGRSAFARGRMGRARAKFEAALEAQPGRGNRLTASLCFYRSQCLYALNRATEAKVDLLKALELGFQPESAQEALATARALLRYDAPNHAIPILEAYLLNGITDLPEAWTLLGRALRATNASNRAISAFTQALQLDPKQADVLALRGGLFRRMDQLSTAQQDYKAALSLNPQSSSLRYALGLTQLQLGQIPAAAQNIKIAAQALPKNFEIQRLCALLALTINDFTTAQNALENIPLASRTNDPTTQKLTTLIQSLKDTPITKEAQELTNKATSNQSISPNIAFYQALEKIHTSSHLAEEATLEPSYESRKLLEIAAQGDPDQPETLCAHFLLKP